MKNPFDKKAFQVQKSGAFPNVAPRCAGRAAAGAVKAARRVSSRPFWRSVDFESPSADEG
jgi:hypothetical protein